MAEHSASVVVLQVVASFRAQAPQRVKLARGPGNEAMPVEELEPGDAVRHARDQALLLINIK